MIPVQMDAHIHGTYARRHVSMYDSRQTNAHIRETYIPTDISTTGCLIILVRKDAHIHGTYARRDVRMYDLIISTQTNALMRETYANIHICLGD